MTYTGRMATYPAPSPTMIPARYKGGSQVPRALVIHGTVSSDNAGTARAIAKWWAGSGSPKSSCHYTVDPREVIQSVGDHTVAFHCGSNSNCIGIELCDEQAGPASRWQDADSQAIIRRAARLAAELCLAYNIEVKRPTVASLKSKGKHGIYGHNDSRLAFGGTTHTDPRDFPWAQFLRLVTVEVAEIKAKAAGFVKPPPPVASSKTIDLRGAHHSMQYSDTVAQRTHDASKVFAMGYDFITGTEGGESKALLIAVAKKYGYTFHIQRDSWVAVKKSIIAEGSYSTWGKKVVDTSQVYGPGHDTGYTGVTFTHVTKGVGKISVISSHYPTRGNPDAKDPDRRVNVEDVRALTRALAAEAKVRGAGSALVFYGGDQNIDDAVSDTFLGQPWTSCWDELKKYPNTHGTRTIDCLASYDPDARVTCVAARSHPRDEGARYSDHASIAAAFRIRLL